MCLQIHLFQIKAYESSDNLAVVKQKEEKWENCVSSLLDEILFHIFHFQDLFTTLTYVF